MVKYGNRIWIVFLLVIFFSANALAVDLTECQDLNQSDTSYDLTQDVTTNATCFTMNGNNSALNCHGFIITYANESLGYAVKIMNNSVSVSDCILVEGNPNGGSHGISISANDTTLSNNTISTQSEGSNGIHFALATVEGINISQNTINCTGGLSSALSLAGTGHHIESNTFYVNGTNADAMDVTSMSDDNTYLNNDFISVNHYAVEESGPIVSTYNYFNYTNSFASIYWKLGDAGIDYTRIVLGETIYLENNNVGIADALGSTVLNSSANITIKGLSYLNQPYLMKNGVRCDDTDACNITSYSGGILAAEVSGFSNYSTQETPSACADMTESTILNKNLTAVVGCYNIKESNMFVDCNGYTINYSTEGGAYNYAFNITGQQNVTIKNCIIVDGSINGGYEHAIYVMSSGAVIIENNTITTNSDVGGSQSHGIYLYGSNATVNNNSIYIKGNSGVGIFADTVQNTLMEGNMINASGILDGDIAFTGISLAKQTSALNENVTIRSNTIYTYDNSSLGIGIQGNNILVEGNSIYTYAISSSGIVDTDTIAYGNLTIKDNTIETIANLSYGIYLVNNERTNADVINNTITTSGYLSDGILVKTSGTNISYNNITVNFLGSWNIYGIDMNVNGGYDTITYNTIISNDMGLYIKNSGNSNVTNNIITSVHTGVELESSSNNNVLLNTINATGNDYGLFLQYASNNSLIKNNHIIGTANAIGIDMAGGNAGTINTLEYENAYGKITWTQHDFTNALNLGIGYDIYLQNNLVGVYDTGINALDSSAKLEIKGLSFTSTNVSLLKDGTRCDDTDACNITYNNATGILYANVSGFSNYTVAEITASGVQSVNVTKTLLDASFASDIAQFRINVTNNGTTNLTSIILRDDYDCTYLTYSASSPVATTNETGCYIEWTIASLNVSDIMAFYANFTISGEASSWNNATVINSTDDEIRTISNTFSIDTIAPTLNLVNITSNNSLSSSLAKAGDEITVTFNVSEALSGDPTATIAGQPATVTSVSGNMYTAKYVMTVIDVQGTISFTIDFFDTSGNPGIQVTEITEGTNVIFDKTAPTMTITIGDLAIKIDDMATITFNFSEAPVGFNQSDITVANGGLSGFQNVSATVYTATFIPTADTEDSTNNITVGTGWTDAAGNAPVAATNSSNYAVDTKAPTLNLVNISSNNTLNSSLAKVGEEITVTFNASESLNGTPTATIAGQVATVESVSGNMYTAKYIMTGTESEDEITFTLNFADSASNTGTQVTQTTDSSAVTFDMTAPISTTVTMASNNTNSTMAKVGDTINITIVSDEDIRNVVVTLGGNTTTVTQGADAQHWNANYTMQADDAEGALNFTIDFTDLAGNPASQATSLTSGSAVIFDRTAPVVSDVSIASDNADNSLAKIGDTITIIATVDETGTTVSGTIGGEATSTNTVEGTTATLTRVLDGSETEGTLDFTLVSTDAAGNVAETVTTANTGSVTTDFTAPTLTINLSDSTLKIGETLTVIFNFSEAPLGFNLSDVTSANGTMSGLNNISATVYTATFTPTADTEDSTNNVTVGAGWTDAAGNAPASATNSTNYAIDTKAPAFDESLESQTNEYGTAFSYDVNASDANLDSYSLIDESGNFSIDAETGLITNATLVDVGTYELTVIVNDTFGNSMNDTINITVQDTANPTFDQALSNQSLEWNTSFSYDVNASDNHPDGVSYSTDDTENFSIDAEGIITNSTLLDIGVYSLTVTITDGSGNTNDTTISINVSDSVKPIFSHPIGSVSNEYNTAFIYDVNASDNYGAVTYSIDDGNFTMNAVSGLINASGLAIGVYTINITITDVSGNSNWSVLTVTTNDNITPAWTSENAQQDVEYAYPFTYDANATDANGVTVSYAINDSNFDIDPSTGIINATLLDVGIYALGLNVTDGINTNSTTLIVNVTDSIDPAWTQVPADIPVTYGLAFLYDANATDQDGLVTTGLVYGLEDNASGNFTIDAGTGIITNATSLSYGNYTLNITVDDSRGNIISKVIILSVQDLTNPVWVNATDVTIERLAEISHQVNATDDSGTVTYNISAGDFSINSSTGLITNNTAIALGTHTLTVTATDSSGNANSTQITVTIQDTIEPAINSTEVNLSASYSTNGAIVLDWNEDTQEDVAKYNVYRSNETLTAPVNSSERVASNITATTWTDTSTKLPNATYYYVITAVDAAGNENASALSDVVNATTLNECNNTYSDWSSWSTCSSSSQSRTRTRTCYISEGTSIQTETQSCTVTRTSSGGSGGGSTTTLDKFAITLSGINPDSGATITISNDEIGFYEVQLEVNNQVNNPKLTFTKLASKPSSTSDPKDGEKVFKYIEVSKDYLTNEDINTVKIKFKIEKSWLEENSLHKSNMKMFRFTQGWDELSTYVLSEDDNFVYFEAITPGFSYFKIAGAETIAQDSEENNLDAIAEEIVEPVVADDNLSGSTDANDITGADNLSVEPSLEEQKGSMIFKVLISLVIISFILITSILMMKGKKDEFTAESLGTTHYDKESHQKKKINEYYHMLKEKGKSDDQIIEKLISVGWDKEFIKKAIKQKK